MLENCFKFAGFLNFKLETIERTMIMEVLKFINYAGFWIRFFALIIDSIVLSILYFAAGFIIGDIFLIYVLITWFYFAGMESSVKQATLGKMALGIVVTNLDGSRINFIRATVRYFAQFLSTIILFIGYLMVAFTSKKQGLHDLIAGTLVVRS